MSRLHGLALGFSLLGAMIITITARITLGLWNWQLSIVSFLACYAVSYALVSLFFHEIRQVNEIIDRLRMKDLEFAADKATSSWPVLALTKKKLLSYSRLMKRQIEDLERTADFRKRFIADVSHELKTPLFSAQGYVHTLLDGAKEDPEVNERFLRKAGKNLDALQYLVEDLMTLSKIESGVAKMNFQQCNAYNLVLDVIEQLENEKKNIKFILPSNKTKQYEVYADSKRIEQVLKNLLSNAMYYSDKGAKIEVQLINKADTVQFQVIDRGIGINENDLDKIFQRFYRVDKSRSKNSGGTGLGLAIVKHILQAHNSEINVVSEIGKGSTFSFRLFQENWIKT